MKESNEILNELASVSPALAAISKVNIFSVPDGYFTDLSERISTAVFLNQYPKAPVRDVPEGYFENLSDKIIHRIKRDVKEVDFYEETKNTSPLLHSLRDRNVFNVPAGYFETLSNQVLSKTSAESPKVISMHTGKKWWRYAAAAVVAALISVSTLQLFNHKESSDNAAHQFATKGSENIPGYIQNAARYKTPEQLDKGIASLSDDEIVAYLEHHGNIMDNYLLTKDIDADGLPDVSEYLIDENTLKNFLNEVDAPASNKNNN